MLLPLVLLLSFGCPAEMLGIPVPSGGIDAISMDDLTRDVSQLSRGDAAKDTPSGEDARREFVAERWRQMGLTIERQGWCGRRMGTGEEYVAVVAPPGRPGDAASWSAVAIAISVAKAFDGRPTPPRGMIFCVGNGPETADAVKSMTVAPVADDPATGDLDYRELQRLARRDAKTLEGWLEPGPPR